MSDIRVFVNGMPADVRAGGSALDAVRAANAAEADAVASGSRAITDSRGLPADPASPAYAGAIYRTVRARSQADGES
jgi:hypothetical protein